MGKNGSKRCFSRTRGAPKQQRRDAAAVDQLAKKLSFTDQMALADEVLQTDGTHPLGKRAVVGGGRNHGGDYTSGPKKRKGTIAGMMIPVKAIVCLVLPAMLS
jgi:hypothetical protein